MKDDYLWDRRGEPDPEVARLERLLAPLAHRPRPFDPGLTRAMPAPAGRMSWRTPAVLLALAATVVLLIRAAWPAADTTTPSRWSVERLTASTGGDAASALAPGRWIVTDARSGAVRLRSDRVGVVDVDPDSRVRLVTSGDGEHRLALERGTLRAHIWAQPGVFVVDTPTATAIDLGCAYELEVDDAGRTRLRVTAGWVGLERGGHEAFIPAGATCATTPSGMLGTPRRNDVSPAFSRALDVVDEAGRPLPADALAALLDTARPDDAFSLWHLLLRLDPASAGRVYERLAVLKPPPPNVTRDRVMARDRKALDAWWDSLGLGDTTWYRAYRAR